MFEQQTQLRSLDVISRTSDDGLLFSSVENGSDRQVRFFERAGRTHALKNPDF